MHVTVHRRIFIGIMVVVIGFVLIVNIMIWKLFENIAYQEVLGELKHSVLSYNRFNERYQDLVITQARAMAETAHLKATLNIPDVDHETVQVVAESLRDVANPDILLVLDEYGELLSNANDANQLHHPIVINKNVQLALSGQFVSGMWSTDNSVYQVAVVPSAIGELVVGAILVGYRLDKLEAIQELQDVTGSMVQINRSDGTIKSNGNAHTLTSVANNKQISSIENVPLFEVSNQHGMWLVARIDDSESQSQMLLYKELDALASIINPIRIAVAIGSLAAILIGLLITNLVASKISRPISNLTNAAVRFGEGELNIRVPKESNDEIGILADGFNNMLTQIQIRDTELRESEKHLSEAQRIAKLGHWTWDFTTNTVHYSDQIEVIFGAGITKENSTLDALLSNIFAEDEERVRNIVGNALLHKNEFEVEYKIMQPGGEKRILHQEAKIVCDDTGYTTRMIGTIQDITDLQNAEHHRHLAYFDSVTNLPNRTYLREHIEKALTVAQETGKFMAIIFVDLDHFKKVNDSLGHSIGDELLKAVGERLKGSIRSSDIISRDSHLTLLNSPTLNSKNALVRFGGDEFVIVVSDLETVEEAKEIPQRILNSLSKHFLIQKHKIHIGASLGVSIYPIHGKDMETLLVHADLAMYKAKDQGRKNYSIYTGSMKHNAFKKYTLEQDLRKAIGKEELLLHYQPRINTNNEQIVGVEALLRWNHPTNGLISPAEFIPLAEESGLIVPIGEWVIHTACAQVKKWQQVGLPTLCASVNVSAAQLKEKKFVDIVSKALEATDLEPQYLELEITEGMLMDDTKNNEKLLMELKNRGVKIALDDFGTGYSSLSYLNRFPFDILKIDRAFIKNITLNDESSALAIGIIALSHSLNLHVVAEGVETFSQLEYLREHECDEIQGYYFSLPLPASEFNERYCHQQAPVTQLHIVQEKNK